MTFEIAITLVGICRAVTMLVGLVLMFAAFWLDTEQDAKSSLWLPVATLGFGLAIVGYAA